MSEEHKLDPFFTRRIDHHKFEKSMRDGISYIYFESKNVEQFKYKLVKATLENYVYYKYNIDIEDLPQDSVENFIKHMIDVYDSLLKMYYYNERKKRGSITESKDFLTDKWFQKVINDIVSDYKRICENDDDESDITCYAYSCLEKITVKDVQFNKGLGKLIVDVTFNSAFSWLDYDDLMYNIADKIFSMYNFKVILTIDNSVNIQDRQMESSNKTLIKKILKEEVTNFIKKYFFDTWDRIKKKGGIPLFDTKLIEALGFSNKKYQIRDYYLEYMGGEDNLEKVFVDYLTGDKEFTTKDIEKKGIVVGGYNFSFKIPKVEITKKRNDNILITFYYKIIQGDVYVINGEIVNLVNPNFDEVDDNLWWEISDEIKDMLYRFFGNLVDEFAMDKSDTNVEIQSM